MALKARGRRGNRGRRLAAEHGPDGGLPASLVGSSLDGPFIVPDLKLWEDAPSCRGVRPPIEARPSPVVVGTNYTTREITLATQGKLPLRAVIWSARSGLGNSIQGFITTFIFAILSGRQLLVSYGGLYGASFETIASGFEFKLDHTEGSVPRSVPMIKFDGNPDISDAFPVVQGNPHDYFDDFWYAKEERRRCVMDSLKCQDLWCVRSKIVRMMLGHPSLALGRAIEAVVHYAPSARAGKGSSRRKLLSGPTRLFPLPGVKAHREQQAPRQALSAKAREGEGPASGDQLRETGEGGRRLLGEGEDDEPGARGLRLQFDVTVHVRSAHKCMEGLRDFQQCRERGLEGAVDTLSYFPELRRQVLVKRWACISYVLSFLLQLKVRRQTQLGKNFRGLFQDPRDKEEVEKFLVDSEHHIPPRSEEAGASPDVSKLGGFNGSQLLKDWGLWTVDAAADVARGEGKIAGGEGELSILLATDMEALRPLYVEYLRPFGSVTYSAAKVVHLAHRTGDDTTRLGNLAEFYLISRASMLLSCPIRRSSYARAAALYGNSTLVYGVNRNGCGLVYEHLAEQMR